jgi:hypothetical protein
MIIAACVGATNKVMLVNMKETPIVSEYMPG